MADNLSVNVTADTTRLTAQIAVANESLKGHQAELRKTAAVYSAASAEMKASLGPALSQQAAAVDKTRAALTMLRDDLYKASGGAAEAGVRMGTLSGQLVRLAHEAVGAEWTRFASTLVVTGEHAGLVEKAIESMISPMGAAATGALALAGGLAYLVFRAHEAEVALRGVASAAALAGESGSAARLEATSYADMLQRSGFVGADASKKIGNAIRLLGAVSTEQRERIAALGPGLYDAWGEDADKTVENIRRVFSSPTTFKQFLDENRMLSVEGQRAWESATSGQARFAIGLDQLSARLAKPTSEMLELNQQLTEQMNTGGRKDPAGLMDLTRPAPVSRPHFSDFQPGSPKGPEPPDPAIQAAAYQKIAAAAAEAGNRAVIAAAAAGKNKLQITEAETAAEIAIYKSAASNEELSERQRIDAAATVARLNMTLVKAGAADGAAAAKRGLEEKVAALSAEQAAARDDFAKVQELEQKKLALIGAALGTRSKMYQDELRNEENMERTHAQKVQQQALEALIKGEQIDRQAAATKKSELDAEVTDHAMTKQDELAELRKFTEQQYQTEREALADLVATLTAGTNEYAKAMQQRTLLDAQHAREVAALNAQMAAADATDTRRMLNEYQQAFGGILAAGRSSVVGLITGKETWAQAEQRIANQVLTSTVNLAGEVAGKWLVTELAKTAATQTQTAVRAVIQQEGALAGLGTLIASWLGVEVAKTVGTTAQAGVRTTEQVTADEVAQAAAIEANVASAESYAAVGGVAAGASVAAIPFVGWAMAPGVAASTYGELAAMGAMASLAVGTDYVPRDMPAYIHQGEAVLNRRDADMWRGGGGGGNSNAVNLHYNPVFHGATAGLPAQARATAEDLKNYLWNQTRNGNLRLPGR